MKTKPKDLPTERLRATTLNIGESQWEWLMRKNHDIGVRPSVTVRKLITRAMEAESARKSP